LWGRPIKKDQARGRFVPATLISRQTSVSGARRAQAEGAPSDGGNHKKVCRRINT
jgi:hypothetical protein